MSFRDILRLLVEGHDLSEEQAAAAMDAVMRGAATPAQVAGFLVALRMKGETVAEITGCARAMRAHAVQIRPRRGPLVDIVGTGGDGSNTFNISTAAALVAAAAGAVVAKHGNRAVSSRCGSADVLEALGLRLDLTPEQVCACIEETGFGFMFAPLYHG
ncbi:MAG: anthranilate phosphoribosyltransferase, partial [Limnochordales bacterium]